MLKFCKITKIKTNLQTKKKIKKCTKAKTILHKKKIPRRELQTGNYDGKGGPTSQEVLVADPC